MRNESFFYKVYDVVSEIPYGKVTSYGAIANFLGTKRSARMVGWALNQTKTQLESIPAHRVVNRNGMLTGKQHFGANDLMRQLLESEGAIIVNDKIINFDEMFWDPARELSFEPK
ncbi:MAG: MGMT family protein [Bacteroidales bacterium]|nr:MGMT family protein [Bacteroidales bacterium]